MCAHAVRVALLKVAGVESVEVSLERAIAVVRLRPGNSVALGQIRDIVKNNGFTAKEATIAVVGNLIDRGGKPALTVTGPNTLIWLAEDPKQPSAFAALSARARAGAPAVVELTGAVESRSDQSEVLVVRTLTELAK